MKAKVAVDIVVDGRDRTLCGKSCPYLNEGHPFVRGQHPWCEMFGRTNPWDLDIRIEDGNARPIRCRSCRTREVRPRTKG